jgi:hypothetical protein
MHVDETFECSASHRGARRLGATLVLLALAVLPGCDALQSMTDMMSPVGPAEPAAVAVAVAEVAPAPAPVAAPTGGVGRRFDVVLTPDRFVQSEVDAAPARLCAGVGATVQTSTLTPSTDPEAVAGTQILSVTCSG